MHQDPYACLGLPPGSPAADIKRRYRQLAKEVHPDRHAGVDAEGTLRALNAAYELLSDPARKAAYDKAALDKAAQDKAAHEAARQARRAGFVPSRSPSARSRRRGPSRRRIAAVTILLLLSAGVGVLLATQNAGPAVTGLISRIAGRPAAPSRPPPSYTFLPTHGAFDDPNAAPPAPAGLP